MCLNDVIRKLLHKISMLADVAAFFQNVIELAFWKFWNSAFKIFKNFTKSSTQ